MPHLSTIVASSSIHGKLQSPARSHAQSKPGPSMNRTRVESVCSHSPSPQLPTANWQPSCSRFPTLLVASIVSVAQKQSHPWGRYNPRDTREEVFYSFLPSPGHKQPMRDSCPSDR